MQANFLKFLKKWRFLAFGYEVAKPRRIRGLRWWDWRETYASFLQGYRAESGYGLTDLDLKLIAQNLAAAIRRQSAQYGRLKLHPSKAIEGAWYSLLERHPALRPETMSALFTQSRRRV